MSVQKTIEIVFKGNDKVSSVIDTVSGGFSTLGEGIGDITGPLSSITDDILKLDVALSALAIGGLVYAYHKSSEFESSLIELKKVVGDLPAVLDKAKTTAIEMSDKYGESSSDILLSMANFKQAGFEVSEAMLLTKNAMDLTIAGNIEASQSSTLLVSTLKGFKAPATEAARLVDILNEVSNNYATNVEQLAIGMARLSPISNQLGLTFEETAGLLTPVIEVFQSGSEASNALRTGLQKLLSDEKPVRDALEKLGVTQKDVNGMLRSGKDILLDVGKAFESLDQKEKLYYTTQLTGIFQAAKMVEVFDGLAKSTEITEVALKSLGSATLEVNARLESSEVAVNKFKEGFANLAIIIGDQFKLSTTSAINGATEIEKVLREMIEDGTFDEVFKVINTFSDDLGDTLSGIAQALPEAFEDVDFSGLINAFIGIRGEVSDIFEDLDLTKPEDLQKVIQFAVDSLESLVTVTQGIIGPLSEFIEKIVSLMDSFNDLEGDTKNSAGELLGWSKVLNTMLGPIGSLLNGLKGIVTLLNILIGLKIASSLGGFTKSFALTGKATSLFAGKLKTLLPLLGKAGLVGGAAAAGFALGTLSNSLIDKYLPSVKSAIQGTIEFLDKLFDITDYHEMLELKTNILPNIDLLKTFKADFDEMDGMIADSKINLNIDDQPLYDWEQKASSLVIDVEVDPNAVAKVQADVERVYETISYMKGNEKIELTFEVDPASLNSAAEVIKEKLPDEKKIEVDIEVEKIKAQASVVQTLFEYTAKVNIADIEAQAKIITSLSDGMASSFQSTGDVISSALGSLSGLDIGGIMIIEDQLKIENELRAKALEQQAALNEAQIKLMDAKAEAVSSGEGIIKVSADGLSPELEMIMWKILEKIQIRANAEAAEFLLTTP